MKKLQLILFNIGLLFLLLLLLEGLCRLAGMQTIAETEKSGSEGERYKQFCIKCATTRIQFYDNFYTDEEGIFRANPDYFADPATKKQAHIGVNKDGFRGNAFEYVDTQQTKILLIGDSFVWGQSAEPITHCFADLLQRAGYYVYNGGIPGTDPQQYALITKKYLPVLKPDIVAVCVYLGNDVSDRPLLMRPNKNLHYSSSIGFLLGYDDSGRFFNNAEEAFTYFSCRKCGRCSDAWNCFLFKTIVGKAVYLSLHFHERIPLDSSRQWVTKALTETAQVCREHDAKLFLFMIPFVNSDTDKERSIEERKDLFKTFSYYYPDNIQKSDYRTPGKHFNNSGHQKFAAFIMETLKQNKFPPNLENQEF